MTEKDAAIGRAITLLTSIVLNRPGGEPPPAQLTEAIRVLRKARDHDS